ncbi:MAG: hypothetical protein NTU73_03160 [Ignavibacteriae bacterium]|nr:hypothetical protein [Ignavibacteriota bacterium]
MKNPEEEARKKISTYMFFLACAVVLVFVSWSVVTDTLIPLYRDKEYDELIYNIFGIPLILIGTGIFAFGGRIFIRDTRELFDNPQLTNNIDIIRDKKLSKEKIKIARSENTRMLFSAWKKGFYRLLIGAIFIVVGGLIINLKKIIE